MRQIKEWQMIMDLCPFVSEMENYEAAFLDNLVQYLDPFLPFLEQQSDKQLAWLNKLYHVYVEGYEYDDD